MLLKFHGKAIRRKKSPGGGAVMKLWLRHTDPTYAQRHQPRSQMVCSGLSCFLHGGRKKLFFWFSSELCPRA